MVFLVNIVGLPPRYRDSVRTITPGLPLFLYNYSTHQLHGIFEVCIMFVCAYLESIFKGNNINIWWCLFRLQVLVEVILIQQLGRIRSAPANLVSLLRYNLQSNYYHSIRSNYLSLSTGINAYATVWQNFLEITYDMSISCSIYFHKCLIKLFV